MEETSEVGKSASILIGPHKGQTGIVVKVETDAGAASGWYTLDLNGTSLLYAGNEIRVLQS